MIFTGVTGGEIISLLYPLFILSPFCYIIISKESLDGAAYQYSWNGSFFPDEKNEIGKWNGWFFIPYGNAPVWDIYRRECFFYESGMYVCAFGGREDSGKDL